MKAIIRRKFGTHHKGVQAVESFEKKPDSVGRRETLKEEIVNSGAAAAAEVLGAARYLLENLKKQPGGQEIVQQIVTGNQNIFSGTGDVHIGEIQSSKAQTYRWRHDSEC